MSNNDFDNLYTTDKITSQYPFKSSQKENKPSIYCIDIDFSSGNNFWKQMVLKIFIINCNLLISLVLLLFFLNLMLFEYFQFFLIIF